MDEESLTDLLQIEVVVLLGGKKIYYQTSPKHAYKPSVIPTGCVQGLILSRKCIL